MTDLRKRRRGNPWREHLTAEEESEMAGIDAKIQVLRDRARRLSFKRAQIQNRATQRYRYALLPPAPEEKRHG